EEIGGERIVDVVNIIQSRLAEMEKELLVDADFVVSNTGFFQAVGSRNAADTRDFITTANFSLALDDISVIDGDGKRLVDTNIDEDPSQEDALLAAALLNGNTTALLIEENDGVIEVSLAAAAPVISNTGNRLGAIQMSRYISGDFLES